MNSSTYDTSREVTLKQPHFRRRGLSKKSAMKRKAHLPKKLVQKIEWPEGWAPLSTLVGSPLGLNLGRFLIPARAREFSLGMNWNRIFGDPERLPGMLIRCYLITAMQCSWKTPALEVRRLTLNALTIAFARKGAIGALPDHDKDSLRPRKAVACVLHLLLDYLDTVKALEEQNEDLVAAADAKTVLRKGEPISPFDAAEELVTVLSVAFLHKDWWQPLVGIAAPKTSKMSTELRKGLLAVAKPSKMFRADGRASKVVSSGCTSNIPVEWWHSANNSHPALRVDRLFTLIDAPQDTMIHSAAELLILSDWMAMNRSKLLHLQLRNDARVLIPAGCAYDWLHGTKVPTLLPYMIPVEEKKSVGPLHHAGEEGTPL